MSTIKEYHDEHCQGCDLCDEEYQSCQTADGVIVYFAERAPTIASIAAEPDSTVSRPTTR